MTKEKYLIICEHNAYPNRKWREVCTVLKANIRMYKKYDIDILKLLSSKAMVKMTQ